jgi:DNA polymerase/3'-5' exonuclease PolX
MTTERQRFNATYARALAGKLVGALLPFVERIEVAGSLRRRKPEVKDIELVYIPKTVELPVGLFGETQKQNVTDHEIDRLIEIGILAKRQNVRGSEAWGEKNKLAVLVKTGMPVDLFATTEDAWFNYLVCRTGSAETNTRIAFIAQKRGWKWNPYGSGFTSLGSNEPYLVRSEQDVFSFLGIPYLEPWQR